MRGLFGGELEDVDGASVERVAPEVVQALVDAPRREPLPPLPEAMTGVDLVLLEVQADGVLRCGRSLAGAEPMGLLTASRAAALEMLARVAAAIAVLHAADACHGDLGPETIRVPGASGGGDGVAILVSATRPAPGALLRARLRGGAPPAIASFSAPEVVTGYAVTPASDVYSLSALAHEIVTGRAPLGQIDFDEAAQGPFARLAVVLQRGLAASPDARPSADALARALHDGAVVARGLEQPGLAGPYRGSPEARAEAPRAPRAQSPAEASARKEQASSMSGVLVLLLVVGGLFVFMGAVWLGGVTWSALDGGGRSVLMIGLTTAILGTGAALGKKGYARSARALIVLGVELLWADGAYLLALTGHGDEPGAWAVLAAVLTAVAFGLAGVLDSALLAALAALHFTVFAGVLGRFLVAYLHTGAPTGPASYALAVALAAAALAFAGHRVRGERLGTPFAVLAATAAFGSAMASLVLLGNSEHVLFGTAWPYVVAGIALAAAVAPVGRYAVGGAVAAGAILTIAPTTEALVHDTLAYLLAAIAVGFVVLSAAFTWPRLRRDTGVQATWALVGLTSVVTSASIRFLSKCWDKDGLDTLTGPDGIYLILVILVPGALLAASFALGSRARQKMNYRLLELAGLSVFFGTFTLQSLVRYHGSFYPVAILAAGAACLVVGAANKRATLVLLASGAVLFDLSVQFFVKLWDVLPASLLAVVFGVALLAGGVLYERRLKHLLPGLREWG